MRGKSNLQVVLIAVTMAAAALTGLTQAWLGNKNVSSSFYSNTENRLVSQAQTSARSVEKYFGKLRVDVGLFAEHPSVISALTAFRVALDDMGDITLSASDEEQLLQFYENEFVPTLSRNPQSDPIAEIFMPETREARYLQFKYIAENPAPPDEKDELSDAGDDSPYTREHANAHLILRDIKEKLGLVDLFLIDPQGRVVYSVIKEIDFMSDLVTGPYNDSGLAQLFENVLRERATRPIHFEDYSFYLPSFGAPSFFIGAPIYDRSLFVGVLAVQISPDEIQNILSLDGKQTGLGEGGDVFIVANDGTVRSSVRGYATDKEAFLTQLRARGEAADVVERIGLYDTPINLLSAENFLRDADEVESYGVADGFAQQPEFAALAQMDIAGLDWTIVASVPVAEADKPIGDFQRTMMLALAATVALTTIGATFFSRRITQPLRLLTENMERAAAGQEVDLRLDRNDEIGDLSQAAQTLVNADREQLEKFEAERVESFEILKRFLPERVVRFFDERRGEGIEKIGRYAEPVENASFVMGRLSGYKQALAALPADQAVEMLDELVRAVDVAADKHGVEKIRTAGDTYFAVAGLSNSLIDHRRRALAFARDLRDIVRVMGGGNVGVAVAIVSGGAISGVIGRQRLAFDLWGSTVEEVRSLLEVAQPFEILVDEEFSAAMRGTDRFSPTDVGFRLDDNGQTENGTS